VSLITEPTEYTAPVLNRDYDTQTCSIARSLEVIGERWSLLIIRDVLQGRTRFDDIRRFLGIPRGVLTARLKYLIDEGVLERHRYLDHPPRHEYRLTPKGLKLWPVLVHLARWGDEFYLDARGAPLIVEHIECGGHPDGHLLCDRCGVALTSENTVSLPGPAFAAQQT
jgi:DNA-binding HxlR family transcriptional regulator